MDIKNAYEVLDQLAEKSNIFTMIRDEMKRLQEENAELKADNIMSQQAILELSMLLGGMI